MVSLFGFIMDQPFLLSSGAIPAERGRAPGKRPTGLIIDCAIGLPPTALAAVPFLKAKLQGEIKPKPSEVA